MKFSKYINNISALQYTELARYGTLFMIGVLFTKSQLSAKEIGFYESFMFIAGAVSFFWLSGLIKAFLPLYNTSKTFANQPKKKSPEFFSFFCLVFFINILVIILLLLFKNSFTDLIAESSDFPYINLLLVYIFLNNPSGIIEYIYLLNKKLDGIIIYSSSTYFLQLIIVGLMPIFGFALDYIFYALIFISSIRFIWLIILVFRFSLIKLSFSYIKEHILIALPLILSLFLSGSAQYIDGFLVTLYFNEETFAVFRYGARELPIAMLLANALSMAMLPEFSKQGNLSAALNTIRSKSLKLMHFLFPITIVLLMTSHWLYPRVFNSNFTESANVFNAYLLLIISRLTFPQTILTGLKKNKSILMASTIELIINFGLSILLIKYLGITGVALATVFAFIVEKIILITSCNKFGIKPQQYIPAKWLLIYSFAIILIYIEIDFKLFELL
ncbi:MAG: polysaccharide biosynthesis C-terminal domain-containing protein [Bacteroidota bacterium]